MWIGKFILGLLGLGIGGFPGFLVGLLVGHLFDSFAEQALRDISGQVGADSSDLFVEGIFAVMGMIAKADGRVSDEEIRGAEQVIARLGLDPEGRKSAIGHFNAGKSEGFDLEELLGRLRLVFMRRPEAAAYFLEVQIQIAIIDGVLDHREMQVLEQVAGSVGIPPAELEAIVRRMQAERDFEHFADTGESGPAAGSRLAKAYEVLGVEASAPNDQVKKAYRRLMNRHHPDKLMAQGVPEETLRLATEHSQRIQDAWEVVRRARGIR